MKLTSLELRNRIYELAAISDTPVRIKKKTVATNIFKGRNQDAGTFAGLTRVCRLVREEYRPIQRREARVEVELGELTAYLDTFHGIHADKNSTPRQLMVVLCGLVFYDEGNDILPLLIMRTTKPSCVSNLLFRPEDAHDVDAIAECKDLNELFHHNHPGWLDAIRSGALQTVAVDRVQRTITLEGIRSFQNVGFTRKIVYTTLRTDKSLGDGLTD